MTTDHGSRHYEIQGARLPSVTTILAKTKDDQYIKRWKAKVGYDEAERIANQQEFQKQRMDSQNQLQKEIMELAAQHGALTPEVVQEMLRQQTAQKAIDGKEEDSE